MTKEEKAALWAERIQEFHSSDLSCKEWCTKHEIYFSTMTYWLRKQRKNEQVEGQDLVFAKLPSESELAENIVSIPSSPLRIFLSKDIRIEISDSCKPELLETVLRILKSHD